jgi:hypothetical protein
VLAAHRCERKVDEKLAGARKLEERAVDRKQDDERGGNIHGHAEDALERHVHMSGEPGDVVTAVGPRHWEIWPDHRVNDEQNDDEGHDPS